MTDSNGLQHSLVALGSVALALAFAAFIGYALVLNAALSTKARSIAGAAAASAAGAFVAITDPWVNGVILLAIAVVGVGTFAAAAWVISAACGLTGRRTRQPANAAAEAFLPSLPPPPSAAEPAPAVRQRPHRRAHST